MEKYETGKVEYADTDIIDERNTSDVNMFPVKRILQELDDVLSDGIFG